jgi:hypothetical protein
VPTTRRKSKFKPDEIVIAIDSSAGTDIRVPVGMRIRADHPIVKRLGEDRFAPDGTPDDELERLRQQLNKIDAEPFEPPVRTIIEKRIPDEDAMVQVVGFGAGTRAHKKSKVVNSGVGTWVPVMPDPKLKRQDALLATETMRTLGEDGKVVRVVYAGQLIHRDDEFVTIHPHSFAMPHVQVREEA